MAARLAHAPETRPGRVCPLSYRYSPRVFDRAPKSRPIRSMWPAVSTATSRALDALVAMALREPGPVTLVFNGDFHWFDVEAADFRAIAAGVEPHWKLRGNVETEIANEESGAGCGCAYPVDVSDTEVSRSNQILERLRATARSSGDQGAGLAALPMHLGGAGRRCPGRHRARRCGVARRLGIRARSPR
jgi:hypothetical protein